MGPDRGASLESSEISTHIEYLCLDSWASANPVAWRNGGVIVDEFLGVVNRDYRADVTRLNASLRLKDEGELAPHVPPHTFVGDINNMKQDDCVLVIGINPLLWHDPRFEKANIELPMRCLKNFRITGDVSEFADWIDFQTEYFLREERNEKHFNKIGRLIGPRYFPSTYKDGDVQQTLHRHVVEVDIVQYFSRKAQINAKKLADLYHHDPALIANMNLIKTIIDKIKPKWIQVNGKTGWEAIHRILIDGEMELINDANDKGSEIKVGFTNLTGRKVPVLMHKFIGGMGGANSLVQREQVLDSWDRWLAR
tara:strand:+ start:366 stop:1295 length:930 start_codon:yes stop_codon:yes gene_type:complete